VTVGTSPQNLAIGDLNGDGKPDLAVTIQSGPAVSVLLGDGAGGFGLPTHFGVGADPAGISIGDFNGDGKLDLAVAHTTFAGTVSVLLGNGLGGFGEPTSVAVGGDFPGYPAIGYFNGDGIPDLATPNGGSNTVSVLLGNGAGGFSPVLGSPFPVGTNPWDIAIGDFDGDEKLDLATANRDSHNVSVLLDDGAGGFSPAPGSPFSVGTAPLIVAIGDLNGDGKLDLATANRDSDTVSVLLGDGAGGFSPAPDSPFSVGTTPTFVAIGDLNGDGKPDLAVSNETSNDVSVLVGDGAGGFSPAPVPGSPIPVGASPQAVAIGDLNGDGKPDLATVNGGTGNVSVLLNVQP
jgi:hypothetical protein